jgi:hypothetical protein
VRQLHLRSGVVLYDGSTLLGYANEAVGFCSVSNHHCPRYPTTRVLLGPADMWLIECGVNAIRNTRNTPSAKTEVTEQARSLGLWILKNNVVHHSFRSLIATICHLKSCLFLPGMSISRDYGLAPLSKRRGELCSCIDTESRPHMTLRRDAIWTLTWLLSLRVSLDNLM